MSTPKTPPVQPFRLVRPSERAAELARKVSSEPATLSVRVQKATLRAIHKAAVNGDQTVKAFVLEALRARGVDIAPEDLDEP